MHRCLPILSLTCAISAAACAQTAPAPHNLPFTLSKQTTVITTPLLPDGRPDYLQVLNTEHSQGVTPQNNGYVLWLQSVGPGNSLSPADRHHLFALCGATAPPDSPFLSFYQYLKQQKLSEDAAQNRVDDLSKAGRRFWSQSDFPELAAYLKTIAPQLAKVSAAVERPRWWMPVLGNSAAVAKFGYGPLQEIGRAFCARAMMRMKTGDFPGFLADLTAARTLAHQVGNDETTLEWIIAGAIDSHACAAEGVAAGSGKLTDVQCAALEKLDAELQPLPPIWKSVNQSPRWEGLDLAMMVAIGKTTELDAGYPNNLHLDQIEPRAVDWNSVLGQVNQKFDRTVKWMKMPDFDTVQKDEKRYYDQALAFFLKQGDAPLAKGAPETDQQYTKRVADTICFSQIPLMWGIDRIARETLMREQMLKALLAAAHEKAKSGHWPTNLEELVPAYLQKLPRDIYSTHSEQPVKCTATNEAFRIYSIGPNARDDGGVWDSQHGKDDIVVGLPESPPKIP